MPNLAGAVSSLLMSLPLIAVPCLAVFGLPSIGPATAEAEADDAIELGPASASTDSLGVASEQPPAVTGFTPIVDATSTAPFDMTADTRADRHGIDQTSDRRGALANHAVGIDDEPGNATPSADGSLGADTQMVENPFADVQPPKMTKQVPTGDSTAPSVTPGNGQASVEQIIAQLRSKGVEEYYLANGENDGEFYFTCFFETDDHTTQRFEAEGASPLDAASTVLAEVEEWHGTH